MNISTKKQKEPTLTQQSQKKQQLISQIIQIQTKTSQLAQLQSQIQTIQNLIKSQQSKTNKINFSRTADSTSIIKRNSNSNKKIKVYQLKKKLEARAKEYKDQHIIYMNRLRKQEEVMIQITQNDANIREEKIRQNQLHRLYGELIADFNRLQQKVIQNKALLTSQNQVLVVYKNQKIKKIQEIKRLKKIIALNNQNTQPDDDIAYMDQINDNNNQDQPNFQLQLTLNNSPNHSPNLLSLSDKRKYSEQILIQDDISELPLQVSFKKHRITPSTDQIHYKSFQQSKICPKKLIARSFQQLQHEVIQLQQKIQKQQKKYQALLQSVSLIKRGNRNLQASAKHSIITLQLLKNKIQALNKTNDLQNKEMLENITRCELLYKKLRVKQGQRGQIRGKLGIKVQNTRMLGIINQQISLDLQKVQSKLPKLKNLAAECMDIVKRLIDPEHIVSQNYNNILQ